MPIHIHILKLRIGFIVEQDEGEYYVHCPELKGLHVGGATEEEALKNARDAVEGYISSLLRHHQPIPVGVLEGRATYTPAQLVWMLWRSLFPSRRHAVVEEISVPVPA